MAKLWKVIALGLVLFASATEAKAEIDVETVSKLVAHKQEELKNQLIEQVILSRLSSEIDSNEYKFLQNTVGVLLSSADKDAVQRGLVREFYRYAKNSSLSAVAIESTLVSVLTDSARAVCLSDLEGCLHVIDMNLFVKALPKLWALVMRADSVKSGWIAFPRNGSEARLRMSSNVSSRSANELEFDPPEWYRFKRSYTVARTAVAASETMDTLVTGWFHTPNGRQARWLIDQILNSIYYDTAAKKPQIDLPVVLSNIQSHYGGMTYKWLEPVFDIGINYGMDFDRKTSYGFATEKLGGKIKVLNYKYGRSQNRGPTLPAPNFIEPSNYVFSSVVNDVHLLVFASGLLYNVTSLPDYPSPKTAFVGIGPGLSFANGLDMNVYWGIPFDKDKSDWYAGFLGLGFDIQVGEYLSALKAVIAK